MDARLPPRPICAFAGAQGVGFCKRLELPGPSCDQKSTQLMMLASRIVTSAQSVGEGFRKLLQLEGACDQKTTQLMLLMLASRHVTSAQSLGRRVSQASAA